MSIDIEKLLRRAVRKSFTAGEQWGVTYSTWFTPTTEETEAKMAKVRDELLAELRNAQQEAT